MKYKLTVVLALLNILLFGTLFYMEKVRGAQQRFQADSRLVLPMGFVERIEHIRVEGVGETAFLELRRNGNRWDVEAPVSWPANAFAIDNLLHRLAFLEWRNRFSVRELERAGQSLEQYGLEPPRLRLVMSAGDEQVVLALGDATELGNSLYMLSPDAQQVLVTGRDLLYLAAGDSSQFYHNRILTIAPFEARNLTVQRSGSQASSRVQLVRTAERWRFETPILAPADQRLVQQALEQLHAIEVDRFLDPDPTAQGLVNPSVRITVGAGMQRQTLWVGGVAGTVAGNQVLYAKLEDRPAVFTIPSGAIELVRNAQETFAPTPGFGRSASQAQFH
ncbi:MAG: DUF4340 domain-containing protein [Verrucomicrobia bacterium]|nr:DUF4340 domain-containing protein [Verrucomicrobiota bacterium]